GLFLSFESVNGCIGNSQSEFKLAPANDELSDFCKNFTECLLFKIRPDALADFFVIKFPRPKVAKKRKHRARDSTGHPGNESRIGFGLCCEFLLEPPLVEQKECL